MENAGLFDRYSQAPDQPRHFIELHGVVILDRLREPDEALVVGHRRHIAWNDRWHRAIGMIEMSDGHQITSRIEPAEISFVPE
jgi:hypothetical protein